MRRRPVFRVAGLLFVVAVTSPGANAADLMACALPPANLVADGHFKGSLQAKVQGRGGAFVTTQSLSGPLELDVVDAQAKGTVEATYAHQLDMVGMDGHGAVNRSSAKIDIAGPARITERIRGRGPLGAGMAEGSGGGHRATGSATPQQGEIILNVRETSCGRISGDLDDGTVKDMRDSATGLGATPTVTSTWDVKAEDQNDTWESEVKAAAAAARQGEPNDAKLEILRKKEKELFARSAHRGDYFECLAGDLRVARVEVSLRRVELLLANNSGGEKMPRAVQAAFIEQLALESRKAILAGADEGCVIAAVIERQRELLGDASRELRTATNLRALLALAQHLQLLGQWTDDNAEAFQQSLVRLGAGG
jgi:hypothetical protein